MPDDTNPLNLTTETLGEIIAYAHQASTIDFISTNEESETARMLRAKLKTVESKIEGARVTAKAPYLEAIRTIDGLARVICDQITPQIKRIDALRLEYANHFKAPAPMPAAPMSFQGIPIVRDPSFSDIPDLSALATGASEVAPTIKLRTTRDVEVFDLSLIPREFLVVDMVLLRKAMIAGNRDVPGARVIEKTSVLE